MITKKRTTKKRAMSLVDKISRIPIVPLRWKSTHGTRDTDDERKDGHDDECLERKGIHQLGRTSPANQLTLYRVSDFLPPFGQLLNAISGGI